MVWTMWELCARINLTSPVHFVWTDVEDRSKLVCEDLAVPFVLICDLWLNKKQEY